MTLPLPPPEFFGTGTIARLFGVSPRTVAKWIDSGLLPGHRIPGSRRRRVARAELERFAQRHRMALAESA